MELEAARGANAEAQANAAPRGNVEAVRLLEGLPEKELIRQIHYFRRIGEVGHRGLAFYLLQLQRRGLHRPKAKSAAKWAAKELDLHVKFARRLIHTARKLEDLGRTDRLFSEGKLPWTKVEIIASVATAKTEEAWIDYALRHGYAELRAAAAREVYERALERARAALGPGATPAEAFEKLCEMALGAAAEGAPPGGDSAKAAPRARPSAYTVVVHVDPEGIYLLEDGPDGRTIRQPVAPEDLARILGLGARVVAVPPIALEGEVKTIAFGERGSVPEEERAPRLSAEERELVLLREGFRCFACGSREDLTIAHLVARAKGGGNDLRFLAAACKRCHGGEHEGRIRFFAEGGRLEALDREGRPLDASVSDAEALASDASGAAGLPMAARAEPRSFREFVGQERAAQNIKLLLRAARARGEVPGPILLSGPAGVGKSTLAALVARESGGRVVRALGAEIEPSTVVSLLGELRRGDVLFLDEIHGLSRASEEALYSALGEGCVNVLVADSATVRARSIRVRLEPFTLVGATTQAGALSESFRTRFSLQETLKPYGESELAEIVVRAAKRVGVELGAGAARAVAERARSMPREALRLFERAWDVATVDGRKAVTARDVEEGAERLGLGADGLFEEERRILDLLLERRRAIGIDAMAELLATDRVTLEAAHEPWLVRRGLVERTERGRAATRAGATLRARFPELGSGTDGRGSGGAGGNGNGTGEGKANGNGEEPGISSG